MSADNAWIPEYNLNAVSSLCIVTSDCRADLLLYKLYCNNTSYLCSWAYPQNKMAICQAFSSPAKILFIDGHGLKPAYAGEEKAQASPVNNLSPVTRKAIGLFTHPF